MRTHVLFSMTSYRGGGSLGASPVTTGGGYYGDRYGYCDRYSELSESPVQEMTVNELWDIMIEVNLSLKCVLEDFEKVRFWGRDSSLFRRFVIFRIASMRFVMPKA